MSALAATAAAKTALDEMGTTGKFVRTVSTYRETISKTHERYQPEAGRYQLYVSLACPWANRCVAVINMKGLQDCIGISTVHPTWQRTRPSNDQDKHCGWAFIDVGEGKEAAYFSSTTGQGKFYADSACTSDPVNGAKFVRDIYEIDGGGATKYTVPVLFDKKTNTIVNNESSEILRILTVEFDDFATGSLASLNLYPEPLRAAIDEVNTWVYTGINDGMYLCRIHLMPRPSVLTLKCQ
jgi:glutathionyl-hydroquinone reductase